LVAYTPHTLSLLHNKTTTKNNTHSFKPITFVQARQIVARINKKKGPS
jgi:hypothetical protein